MIIGPLQWYFLFGFIQNDSRTPISLKLRPEVGLKLFYHIIERSRVLNHETGDEHDAERREIASVEHIVAVGNKTIIDIVNLAAKLEPSFVKVYDRLMKRPYYDRLEKWPHSGDFRSVDGILANPWAIFPSPESLMAPDFTFHERQKWAVKMVGGAFQANYELVKVDDEQHMAYIEGRNGVCLNGMAGNKRWDASWIVDTRKGVIRRLDIKSEHEIDRFKTTTRKNKSKVLMRKVEAETLLDFELEDDDEREEL